jgi:hypothetical protein
VNDGDRGLFAIADTVNDGDRGLFAIADTVSDGDRGLFALADTVNDGDRGLFTIADTVNDPSKGIAAIAHQVGLTTDFDPPVPALIRRAVQAKLAVKFVDDLVPLTIWWLFEEPGEHRHERLLRRDAQHATKIVAPEQFCPGSLVQLHAIVPVNEYRPWFIFDTMLDISSKKISESEGLEMIAVYWNNVKTTYGPDTHSDPIPQGRYLEDAVRRVYVLFSHVHDHLRNIS